jgi:ubiquinone/menaquinone biosynthesis C-methylase UbiE
MQAEGELASATKVWNDPNESMESVALRIHDGVPLGSLEARAQSYVDCIFDFFPYARPPTEGASIMEIGSGIGYIMEAMDKGCRARGILPGGIIGLDIAEHMLGRAKTRLSENPVFSFLHYDGRHVPLPDRSLDVIYSVSSLQHVPRPNVFHLFFETLRLLRRNGYAIIHLLGVKNLRPLQENVLPWRDEIKNQVTHAVTHWHHYYSAEELENVFSVTGFGHFDVRDGVQLWSLVQPSRLCLPTDFDRAAYLQLNPDVAVAGADPEEHWLLYGHRENRRWR